VLHPGATIFCVFVVATAIVLLAEHYVPILLLSSAYLLAIIPVAVMYGLGFGMAAAILSSVACDYFFFRSAGDLQVGKATDVMAFVLFAVAAVIGSSLGTSLRRRHDMLARDQAALRHIAALVSRRVSPADIFATIAEEVARDSAAALSHIVRYESDGSISIVASWSNVRGGGYGALPLGERLRLDGPSVEALVYQFERPARIERFEELPGHIADIVRRSGIRCEVGSPILVDGRVWGAMVVSSTSPRPLPPNTEERIVNFAELASVAVSHAETRVALIESRARLVASADQAREQIERDLHDSVQQQLISVALRLHNTSASSSDSEALNRTVKAAEAALAEIIEEIRLIVHGLLPPVLAQAGLAPALRALARRFPIPVPMHIDIAGRLAKEIETATYFVVSEALTNACKHARATTVKVTVTSADGQLHGCVEDDGAGGADASVGSGLSGLANRVEALGGWLSLSSPPGKGTAVKFELPLVGEPDATAAEVYVVAHRY
jgi:signal transduction histidine kinase